MKFCFSQLAALAILLVTLTTARADLFWDTNGAAAGGSNSTTAAGTWGVDSFWSTSPAGTSATGAWVADSVAVFSAGTNVTGTYNVTLSGTQSTSGIRVEEGNVTITGGTELTIVPSTGLNPDFNGDGIVDARDYVVWRKSIGTPEAYDAWKAAFGGPGGGGGGGTAAVFDVASGLTATMLSPIGGDARLAKTGAGTLHFPVLAQPNTYTGGTTISGGMLIFHGENDVAAGAPNALGAVPASAVADHIIIENGATLRSTDDIVTEYDFVAPNRGITIGSGGGILDIADPAAVLRYAGQISGSERWTKAGSGRLRLAANNPFTGGFRVTGGVLVHSSLETANDAPGTMRQSGVVPDNVTPDYVILDGGTIEYNNTGVGSTFLATRKGITVTENGGGISLPGNPGNPAGNTSISNYFGKVSAPNGGTLYKRGHGEIRPNKLSATDDAGWDHTQLVVEEGLFRVGNFGEEALFGKVPETYVADAIRLDGRGTTRVDGAAAIGLTSGTGSFGHNAVTTTPATRGIYIEANGGTIAMSLNTNSWVIESIISGPGGLHVNGNGFPVTGPGDFGTAASTLVLKGANSYAGFTNINSGFVVLDGPSAKLGNGDVTVDGVTSGIDGGSAVAAGKLRILSGVSNGIADSALLTLTGGGTAGVADVGYLELGAGINEVVAQLILGGTAQPAGTYGSTASSATFQFDEYFAGTGILTVTSSGVGMALSAVPEPSSIALLLAGLALVAARRRVR